MLFRSLLALTGASLAVAHFEVTAPPVRGYDSSDSVNFPCGGQSVSDDRFQVSLDNPQIFLDMSMGHDQVALQVLLGLGTDPGDNYNITLVPTVHQRGIGEFCLPDIRLSPEALGVDVADGTNATVQVVTNGDPSGGLYNCIDITFSSTAQFSVPDSCNNGTGIVAEYLEGSPNANETTAEGTPQPGTEGEGDNPPPDQPDASVRVAVSWGVLGAAVVGCVALL